MNFYTTRVFEENLKAFNDENTRIIINQGSSSSTKTFSIIQLLILICTYRPNLLVSVVSESLPHLKRGVVRDFKNILAYSFDEDAFNKSDLIYNFENGSQIEFFSADQSSKLRGSRRHILFLNEANNVSHEAFLQLFIRTKIKVILDYNPTTEFWIEEYKTRPDAKYVHSTYNDSKSLLVQEIPDEEKQYIRTAINAIESRRHDTNWFRVYGLGLTGNIEGLIYPNFIQIDDIPQDKGIEFYGLDFGFTNDPTALVKIKLIDNKVYLDELIYETGLTNDVIARHLESLSLKKHYDELFADSAEPKSIEEIHRYGWNIKACPKGQDSVKTGIDKVKQYHLHVTKRSLNMIKEFRNYRYIQDSDGKITNKPLEGFNHTMDALRYGIFGKTNVKIAVATREKF
jgi:phage terminase large subunit